MALPKLVEFQTGGVTLRGHSLGDGNDWLILIHDCDGSSDLDSWRPVFPELANDHRTLLAVDLRGHGASEGEHSPSTIEADLTAATLFARSQGATWIAVLAAGKSATAALESSPTLTFDALVLLSPADAEHITPCALRGYGEPKLFAVGGQNAALQQCVAHLRGASIGWAMLVTVPTESQGTDLLAGKLASQVRERIAAFLAEQRFIARTRSLPAKAHDLDRGCSPKVSGDHR